LLLGAAWSAPVPAALSEEDGTGGSSPLTTCGDDGICNAAVCAVDEDPDCVAENCNADGRCVPTCASDPDCEPRPAPPAQSGDEVYTKGDFGKTNAAVLISGRYKNDDGSRNCQSWVSYTSSSNKISNIGNWIGNAVFDGCDSEVAVFSEDGAAQLIKPETRWTSGADSLDYAVGPPIRVPTSVWVVYASFDYAHVKIDLEAEFDKANDILATSRCGITLDPAGHYHNRTSALADPEQKIGCRMIESVLKKHVGFDENRMNVYVVNQLKADERVGVACTAESDNVIIIDGGRRDGTLVHEFGHWFDLWHTDGMPKVAPNNIMSRGDHVTAGQCYRANFSKDSYINVQGLRQGKTKNCKHRQDADNQCPGLKNEF
jgi:hypothetical protein